VVSRERTAWRHKNRKATKMLSNVAMSGAMRHGMKEPSINGRKVVQRSGRDVMGRGRRGRWRALAGRRVRRGKVGRGCCQPVQVWCHKMPGGGGVPRGSRQNTEGAAGMNWQQ